MFEKEIEFLDYMLQNTNRWLALTESERESELQSLATADVDNYYNADVTQYRSAIRELERVAQNPFVRLLSFLRLV